MSDKLAHAISLIMNTPQQDRHRKAYHVVGAMLDATAQEIYYEIIGQPLTREGADLLQFLADRLDIKLQWRHTELQVLGEGERVDWADGRCN